MFYNLQKVHSLASRNPQVHMSLTKGKITIDLDKGIIIRDSAPESLMPLNSPEALETVSEAWLRCGWDTKYVYSFTWLGMPIIQLPEDLIRIQELVFRLKPDIIIETGVAHGGSLVFYASLCRAMGKGRVVGVDIEIRSHNRKKLESHFLFDLITLVEGDSVAHDTVEIVKKQISDGDRVLVLLDSCHSKDHVLKELQLYSPLVTKDSFIVAMDGIMQDLAGAPRSKPDWEWNNPQQAVLEFLEHHEDFILEEPFWAFNEGLVRHRISYWPNAFLKRVK